MKRLMTTVLSVLAAFSVHAGICPEEQDAAAQIRQFGMSIESMECDFVQTKTSAMLAGSMVSTGKMYYMQPGMLRWEYVTPYGYTFILNGNKVLIRNDGKSDVLDINRNRNRMFKEIARLMMNSIVGRTLTDEESFDISMTTEENDWSAVLVPLKNDVKQMWTKLVLHFNPVSKTATKLEMFEKSGDFTIIEFKRVQTDRGTDASLFTINGLE